MRDLNDGNIYWIDLKEFELENVLVRKMRKMKVPIRRVRKKVSTRGVGKMKTKKGEKLVWFLWKKI